MFITENLEDTKKKIKSSITLTTQREPLLIFSVFLLKNE